MDMKKLCDMLTSREDLKDIPIIYVFQVAYAVFEVINSGECFYDSEEAKCLSSTILTQQEEK